MIPWVPPGLVSDPSVPALLSLGLMAGLLALDDTALAQTWFGQPLPAAVLTGYLFGDPVTGLAVGLPLQLVLSGNLPVGQTFTGDPTSAAISAVGGTLLAARMAMEHGAAFNTAGGNFFSFPFCFLVRYNWITLSLFINHLSLGMAHNTCAA